MFSRRRNADPRVLKIQLDLIAGLGRTAWISTPLWALTLAGLGSDVLGWFGHRPVEVAVIFPLTLTAVCWSVYRLFAVYRADPVRGSIDLLGELAELATEPLSSIGSSRPEGIA